MGNDPAPVGLLIVRAWVERNTEDGLRAVVTRTLDVAAGREEVTHAATTADVLTAVEAWLDALVADRLRDGPDAADGPSS